MPGSHSLGMGTSATCTFPYVFFELCLHVPFPRAWSEPHDRKTLVIWDPVRMSFVQLAFGVEIATVKHWNRALETTIGHGEKEGRMTRYRTTNAD